MTTFHSIVAVANHHTAQQRKTSKKKIEFMFEAYTNLSQNAAVRKKREVLDKFIVNLVRVAHTEQAAVSCEKSKTTSRLSFKVEDWGLKSPGLRHIYKHKTAQERASGALEGANLQSDLCNQFPRRPRALIYVYMLSGTARDDDVECTRQSFLTFQSSPLALCWCTLETFLQLNWLMSNVEWRTTGGETA